MVSFSELIGAGKVVLIDFYAEWCGPCQRMKPVLEVLKQRLGDRLSIIQVDVDKNPSMIRTSGSQGIPTLVLIRNREIWWRRSGVIQANPPEKSIIPYLINAKGKN